MKKIIVIAFVLSLVAAPVFAFTTATEKVTLGGSVICVLSKKVSLGGVSTATRFAAAAAHESGSSQFGTTSESTSIYRTTFSGTLTVPTVSDSSAFSGWDTM